ITGSTATLHLESDAGEELQVQTSMRELDTGRYLVGSPVVARWQAQDSLLLSACPLSPQEQSPMSILIRNATILAMDNLHGSIPFTGDVLIEGDSIRQLGTGLTAPEGATLIDGTGKLVMPGLINSHLHSGEALFKGRYDNMPLELWMLYSYPVLGTSSIDDRIIYL